MEADGLLLQPLLRTNENEEKCLYFYAFFMLSYFSFRMITGRISHTLHLFFPLYTMKRVHKL